MQEAIDISGAKAVGNVEAPRVVISAEVIIYLALLALAIVLRTAELDTVPMMPTELPQALAAWRAVSPMASGEAVVPPSALLFALQSISFTLMGGSEVAARLLTALAGAAVVVSPVLFRGALGSGRALVLSLLLLCSPVLLAASRFSSPAVWSLLVALVGMWGVWRWSQSRQPSYGILAAAMGFALVFLTEPGGPILAVILALAGVAARTLQPTGGDFEFDEDSPETPDIGRSFPWTIGAAVGGLLVIAVATGFMLYPAGLSAVGETLAGAVRGFTQPSGTPLLPFVASVFYEPFMWALGIAAVVVFARRGDLSFADRFLVAWVCLGLVASLLFAGGNAAHALWTTVPLTIIVSRLVTEMLSVDTRPSDWSVPYWARGIIALVTVGLMAIFTMALQSTARAIADSFDGTLAGVNVQITSVILLIIPVLFLVVIYFTAVSLWNARAALRGIGLGVLVFALISSLGSGWVASVTDGSDPLEPFHLQATGSDVFLLRSTLFDIADRQTNGFSTLPITVQASQTGAVAWAVRDFADAEFVSDMSEARGDAIFITTSTDVIDLGGSYVGQDFVVERSWSLQSLSVVDLLAWWTQGRTSAFTRDSIFTETASLWLRQDVYNGLPIDADFTP